MTRRCLLLSLLAIMPAVTSCSLMPATLALYGAKAVMSIKHSSDTAYGYYDLGRYYHAKRQWDAAELAYKKSIDLDARYYEAHNALGVVYSMQGKPDLAIEHFRSAVAIAPRMAHLHSNLGHAYYLQGRNQDAIDSLEAAAALDRRNRRVLHNLNLAYERAGHTEKSEQVLRTLQALRAHDSAVVSGILGEPGSSVQERPSPPVERGAAAAAAADVFARALATAPAMHATVTRVPAAEKPIAGLVLRRSDADATLVLLGSNVYELRVQNMPAPLAFPPSIRQLHHLSAAEADVFRIEVSNGNAVPGAARLVGEHLKRRGFNVVRLTNQVPFRQPVTEIQYRENRINDADKLASAFQQALVTKGKGLRGDIHVRVVLGRDALDPVAVLKPETMGDPLPVMAAALLP